MQWTRQAHGSTVQPGHQWGNSGQITFSSVEKQQTKFTLNHRTIRSDRRLRQAPDSHSAAKPPKEGTTIGLSTPMLFMEDMGVNRRGQSRKTSTKVMLAKLSRTMVPLPNHGTKLEVSASKFSVLPKLFNIWHHVLRLFIWNSVYIPPQKVCVQEPLSFCYN